MVLHSSKYPSITVIILLSLFGLRGAKAQWAPAILEADEWITSVVETSSGHLFIATLSGTAWKFDLQTESLTEFNGVNGGDVWDFYRHPEGYVILDDGDDLLVSNNGGLSWSTLAPFGEINGFYSDGPNWVVSKGDGGAVYRSANMGRDWFLANGASLPEGRDDYSSDPIYNGEILIYRYTEDLANGIVLRQRYPYSPFIRPLGSLEYAMSFIKSSSDVYYAVSPREDEDHTRLIGSTDMDNWSIYGYIPIEGVTYLAEGNGVFAAASLTELAVNTQGVESGEWTTWPIPSESSVITKLLIGSTGHLIIGTDCCLYRSTSAIGTSNETVEQPESEVLILEQAYPNPTNQGATIPVRSSSPQDVQVYFADTVGRTRVLFEKAQFVGLAEISIPSGLAPGVYLIKVKAGSKVYTQSIVVVD